MDSFQFYLVTSHSRGVEVFMANNVRKSLNEPIILITFYEKGHPIRNPSLDVFLFTHIKRSFSPMAVYIHLICVEGLLKRKKKW